MMTIQKYERCGSPLIKLVGSKADFVPDKTMLLTEVFKLGGLVPSVAVMRMRRGSNYVTILDYIEDAKNRELSELDNIQDVASWLYHNYKGNLIHIDRAE